MVRIKNTRSQKASQQDHNLRQRPAAGASSLAQTQAPFAQSIAEMAQMLDSGPTLAASLPPKKRRGRPPGSKSFYNRVAENPKMSSRRAGGAYTDEDVRQQKMIEEIKQSWGMHPSRVNYAPPRMSEKLLENLHRLARDKSVEGLGLLHQAFYKRYKSRGLNPRLNVDHFTPEDVERAMAGLHDQTPKRRKTNTSAAVPSAAEPTPPTTPTAPKRRQKRLLYRGSPTVYDHITVDVRGRKAIPRGGAPQSGWNSRNVGPHHWDKHRLDSRAEEAEESVDLGDSEDEQTVDHEEGAAEDDSGDETESMDFAFIGETQNNTPPAMTDFSVRQPWLVIADGDDSNRSSSDENAETRSESRQPQSAHCEAPSVSEEKMGDPNQANFTQLIESDNSDEEDEDLEEEEGGDKDKDGEVTDSREVEKSMTTAVATEDSSDNGSTSSRSSTPPIIPRKAAPGISKITRTKRETTSAPKLLPKPSMSDPILGLPPTPETPETPGFNVLLDLLSNTGGVEGTRVPETSVTDTQQGSPSVSRKKSQSTRSGAGSLPDSLGEQQAKTSEGCSNSSRAPLVSTAAASAHSTARPGSLLRANSTPDARMREYTPQTQVIHDEVAASLLTLSRGERIPSNESSPIQGTDTNETVNNGIRRQSFEGWGVVQVNDGQTEEQSSDSNSRRNLLGSIDIVPAPESVFSSPEVPLASLRDLRVPYVSRAQSLSDTAAILLSWQNSRGQNFSPRPMRSLSVVETIATNGMEGDTVADNGRRSQPSDRQSTTQTDPTAIDQPPAREPTNSTSSSAPPATSPFAPPRSNKLSRPQPRSPGPRSTTSPSIDSIRKALQAANARREANKSKAGDHAGKETTFSTASQERNAQQIPHPLAIPQSDAERTSAPMSAPLPGQLSGNGHRELQPPPLSASPNLAKNQPASSAVPIAATTPYFDEAILIGMRKSISNTEQMLHELRSKGNDSAERETEYYPQIDRVKGVEKTAREQLNKVVAKHEEYTQHAREWEEWGSKAEVLHSSYPQLPSDCQGLPMAPKEVYRVPGQIQAHVKALKELVAKLAENKLKWQASLDGAASELANLEKWKEEEHERGKGIYSQVQALKKRLEGERKILATVEDVTDDAEEPEQPDARVGG